MTLERDPLGLEATTVHGRYRLEHAVGKGGAAIVYRAVDVVTGQPVAVKLLVLVREVPPEYRGRLAEDLVREGELASELARTEGAVVQPLDRGMLPMPDGVELPYLVLEWLQGSSLDAALVDESRRGVHPRSIEQAYRYFEPVVRVLGLAHARGIAHRDLKPENVFVVAATESSVASLKLLDFGVAKRAARAGALGSDVQRTGLLPSSFTPHYGAPEQFDRAYGETGPHSDVFALALVLLEIARGGRRAFSSREAVALERESKDLDRRPTPRMLGMQVSDAVEAVFQRALAVRSEQRYADARAFAEALEAAFEFDREPASARPVGPVASHASNGAAVPGSSAPSPSRRSGARSIVLGAVVLGIVLIVAASVVRALAR
jgi:serine/threonine protein kinase